MPSWSKNHFNELRREKALWQRELANGTVPSGKVDQALDRMNAIDRFCETFEGPTDTTNRIGHGDVGGWTAPSRWPTSPDMEGVGAVLRRPLNRLVAIRDSHPSDRPPLVNHSGGRPRCATRWKAR